MGALKSVAAILGSLVVLIVIAIALWLWWGDRSAKNLAVKEETVAANATVAAGQAQAAQQAQQIVVAGEARDHVDLTIHQENAHAIASAPGADAPLDPGMVAAVNRGLCRYQTLATDPRCHELRQPDPAELPSTGSGTGAAQP